MRDVHTCSIGCVQLIMTAIWFLGGELGHLVGEVVRGSRVHIPRRIDGVGRGAPMIMTRHRGSLFFIPLAIVTQVEEILLVASMAPGGDVTLKATQLASLLSTATRAASHRTGAASDGGRGSAGLRG